MTLPEPRAGLELGPCTLVESLGEGGFAWVWSAVDRDGKSFAIKLLKPKYAADPIFVTRFEQESRTARELIHPNIVMGGEVRRAGEWVYFPMEIHPSSLARILTEDARPAEGWVARLGSQVAAGLQYAHDRGLVHRDIKPDNILIASDGRAVIADFGLARTVSGYVTATGKALTIGTPHYLSPEQAQGRPLDGRTDIYSLGISLFRAATGQLPFRSRDWWELARMHVEAPPPAPSDLRLDLSRDFEKIVLRCLAKHPDDRFATAGALSKELAALADP